MELEIIIEKKHHTFCAKAPMFPTCIGIGKSEREALERLKRSVHRMISNQALESLDFLLNSKNYKSITIDPRNKSFQHRVYRSSYCGSSTIQTITMKLDKIKDSLTQRHTQKKFHVDYLVDTEGRVDETNIAYKDRLDVQQHVQNNENSFLLSIHLSLN